MSRVQIALAAGLAVVAIAIAIVLSSSPLVVLSGNGIATKETIALTNSRDRACQAGERLPRGTRAVRISLGAFDGPAVSVQAFAHGRLIASGSRGSAWAGQTVTVPIAPTLAATAYPVRVCFASALIRGEVLRVDGSDTKPALAARSDEGEVLPGRVQLAYLGTGRSSWLALASSVATHMGLGRAPSGTWVAFLVMALMIAIAALSSWLVLGAVDE